MSERQIFILLHGLWNDLGYAEFYWELAGLGLILLVSWWVTFRFRRRASPLPRLGASDGNQLRAFGAGGLKRIAFPLIALTLVLLTRQLLREEQIEHLSVFSLAVPLIVSVPQGNYSAVQFVENGKTAGTASFSQAPSQ